MKRVWMAACVLVSLAGCGAKMPSGNGYSTKTPWKKTKPITLKDNAAKVKGKLDFPGAQRARWYTLDLPEQGDLNLQLSWQPTDELGDATIAVEVLDHNYKVISEDPDAPVQAATKGSGDDDSGGGGGDDDSGGGGGGGNSDSDSSQKTRALDSLAAGRYYVHLFVTKKLDAASYELAVSYTPMPTAPKTDFPKNVAWVPPLPVVPPTDDAPAPKDTDDDTHVRKPCKGKKCKHVKPTGDHNTKPPPDDGDGGDGGQQTSSGGPVTGEIIAATANPSGGTDIVVNRGKNDNVEGRHGSINGVRESSFTLEGCGDKSCKAHVKAPLESVKKANSVTIR